jgi:manganese/zinc/iron transport system permease protein
MPKIPAFPQATGEPMNRSSDDIFRLLAMTILAAMVATAPVEAFASGLSGSQIQWPTWHELLRVLTFQDYNTRVVIIGTTLLGLAAGLVGTFLLLRKRALLSDAISHATLPGIALAFIIMSIIWGDGKNLLGLIVGATVFAVVGTAAVMFIQKYTRLKDDAALGIVLSVFFGLGIALMGLARGWKPVTRQDYLLSYSEKPLPCSFSMPS